ncbi:cysteine-rich protein 1-like [Mauremys reevesii]|uniref:cysteine-rich protein 1-like n=1 Tax=Mauremys reevesii TaxID=260615 RepID=UPI00193EF294|nr:cysteine-rich protein 1-like [Mauremys reevesii]
MATSIQPIASNAHFGDCINWLQLFQLRGNYRGHLLLQTLLQVDFSSFGFPVPLSSTNPASGKPKDDKCQSPRRTPKCPRCQKEVDFAEKVTSLGKDWHRPCLKCEKCNKTLTSGGHAEHDGKPYCNQPCYSALFGPKGFGRGGTESHTFK